jgi:hypothetical protein
MCQHGASGFFFSGPVVRVPSLQSAQVLKFVPCLRILRVEARDVVQCSAPSWTSRPRLIKPWRAKQAIILCVCCCLGPRQTKGARRPKLRRGLRGCPASKAATRLLLVILTASSILHVGPYVHFWAQNEVGGRRARPPARHRGRRVNRRRSQPGHPQRPLCAGRRHPPGLREALHGPGQRRSG